MQRGLYYYGNTCCVKWWPTQVLDWLFERKGQRVSEATITGKVRVSAFSPSFHLGSTYVLKGLNASASQRDLTPASTPELSRCLGLIKFSPRTTYNHVPGIYCHSRKSQQWPENLEYLCPCMWKCPPGQSADEEFIAGREARWRMSKNILMQWRTYEKVLQVHVVNGAARLWQDCRAWQVSLLDQSMAFPFFLFISYFSL